MPAGKSGASVQVGDWIVEPALDTISRDGEAQKLEPRTMRLLMCLVDSAGAVVSIERLLSEVWTGVVVGSASVYQAVSQLRKILGDTDPEPTYIATVPRKGYRLIAAVRPVEPPRQVTTSERPDAVTPGATAATTSRRAWLMALCGIALVVSTSLAWLLLRKPPAAETASASIAVLPFLDLSADKNDQPFCDGLTEELSNWLSQIPKLRVVARTSAFAFRGQSEDVRKIGKTLNTSHILEGSMRRSDDHMRVTVQLVDARNGYHLWSANYDRPIDDTIKVQEEISRSVAAILEVRLTQDTAQRFAARRTANPQAYQLYLRARHYQQQRTRDSNDRAIDLYKRVLDADPNFALAYVGLSYARLNQQYFENRPVGDVAAEVEPLIATALRLDARLSDAYSVRGALRSDQSKMNEALDDLHHAISLNSNDSTAYAEMGRIFLWNGQPRDALLNFTRSAALDPLDFRLQTQRCTALADMARYDEAGVACQRARALQPDSSLAADELSWLAASRGSIDEALRWNAESVRAAPDNFDLYWTRANLFLTLGLGTRARAAVEKGRAATKDNDSADAALARVAYCEGGPDAVRKHLTTSRLDKSPHAISLLEAAYSRLVGGEALAAKELITLALAAPDRTPGLAEIPWYARFGTSYRLDLAAAELETGDRADALHQLEALLAMLDGMIDAGVELHLTYELRAEVQALRGNPDDAMRDLNKAVDLGWRRVWWAAHEPYFASIRSRSDFRALMARVSRSNDRLLDKIGSID